METNGRDNSIIIIGAGFAGLSAGIYAQMNGYKTQVFEMHDKPGGLFTSWKRNGFIIDGCIHWLVGSAPGSAMNDFYMCGQWVEPGGGLPTGVMSGRKLMKKICKKDGRKFRTSYK